MTDPRSVTVCQRHGVSGRCAACLIDESEAKTRTAREAFNRAVREAIPRIEAAQDVAAEADAYLEAIDSGAPADENLNRLRVAVAKWRK